MAKFYLGIAQNKVSPAAYSGWNGQLYGCVNDVIAVQKIVSKTHTSFLLVDAQATLRNVVDMTLQIAQRALPGDEVIIHSSGHGSQLRDVSGDEKDGADETSCHFDGELADDHWALVLSQFQAGVNVILITDRCHSATAARAIPQGATREPIRVKHKPVSRQISRTLYEKRVTPITQYLSGLGLQPVKTDKKKQVEFPATILVFSACKDNETAGDGAVNGVFTGAIITEQMTQPATWVKLSQGVQRRCKAQGQTPQLEAIGGTTHSRKALLSAKPFSA